MCFLDGVFEFDAFAFDLEKYTGFLFVESSAQFVFKRGDFG